MSDDNDDEFNKWCGAYVARFGYFPVGINMPGVTAEMLKAAVESGKEIEPLLVPDGADV